MSLDKPFPVSHSPLRRALFLDRDGTLMEEVDHCHEPEKVRAIAGAREALKKAQEEGWLTIIITNQSGIGRGYFSEKEFQAVQKELLHQLGGAIDAAYMAPDHPTYATSRRKPAPGMLLEAAKDFGIDLSASFMIGDRGSDIACGKAGGCHTILVLTSYGKEHRHCGADFIVEDVTAAIELVLKKGNNALRKNGGASNEPF